MKYLCGERQSQRRKMLLERWLQSRASAALPLLRVVLMTSTECPGAHQDHLREAPDEVRRAAYSEYRAYLIMLDFSNSRSLKLVSGPRSYPEYMNLHHCQICLMRIENAWDKFAASDEWREARNKWHDKLDAGRLSWKDALRMIDLIRDQT